MSPKQAFPLPLSSLQMARHPPGVWWGAHSCHMTRWDAWPLRISLGLSLLTRHLYLWKRNVPKLVLSHCCFWRMETGQTIDRNTENFMQKTNQKTKNERQKTHRGNTNPQKSVNITISIRNQWIRTTISLARIKADSKITILVHQWFKALSL